MLEAPLGADTKVTRELANSYRKNVHTGFVDLARRLYFDGKRRTIRKGATNNKAAGNLRDLERTVSRLDMTYDVFGADAKQLMAMLPENRFRRWIKHAIVEGD
jgi:CYTH domain-containing protein